MAQQDQWESYLDKVFKQPDLICVDGICNIDAVERADVGLTDRLLQILPEAGIAPLPLPGSSAIPSTTGRSDVTPSRSAIVPLRSDVWDSGELQNYVRSSHRIGFVLQLTPQQHAQIAIGKVPKPFFVDLDTGSTLLWIQAKLDATDPVIIDQSMYDPHASVTSKNLNKSRNVNYGDGSSVTATLYADEVTAGLLKADSQTLGAAATSDIKDEHRTKSSNGILGLAPLPNTDTDDSSSIGVDFSNIVLNLYDHKRVKYASMSIVGPRNNPRIAEKIDKEKIQRPRGYFVIGSVDPKFYTKEISWCPMLDRTRWIIQLDQVLINGDVVFGNQRALIDTGAAFMVASPSAFKKVISQIPGAKPHKTRHFTYPETSLKSIAFQFGHRKIVLNPQDFSLGKKFYPKTAGHKDDTPDSARCVSSIVGLNEWPSYFGDDLWVLGGMFIDNVVVIFDHGGSKIGLADISEKDLAADPTLQEVLYDA